MQVEIEVANPAVDQDLSLSGAKFTHVGCGPMTSRRDMATDDYELRCKCGLKIRFPQIGEAYSSIVDSTIDDLPRDLPADSLTVTPNASVRILPRSGA